MVSKRSAYGGISKDILFFKNKSIAHDSFLVLFVNRDYKRGVAQMQSCSIARLCLYMAILGGQKKSSSLVTKDFSTAQYLPEESVLAPICAPRVTPDPELLPSLLIYIGLRTYVGRLYYEAYYTTLAILICREGSFRIKLQTKYKHVCVPAASYA